MSSEETRTTGVFDKRTIDVTGGTAEEEGDGGGMPDSILASHNGTFARRMLEETPQNKQMRPKHLKQRLDLVNGLSVQATSGNKSNNINQRRYLD